MRFLYVWEEEGQPELANVAAGKRRGTPAAADVTRMFAKFRIRKGYGAWVRRTGRP
jgi:hypothetical protein